MSKKPHLVKPDSFDDAQEIADRCRCGEVVAIDLVGCEYELARRLVDFSSGICYVTEGELRRRDLGRYLLLPPGRDFDSDEGPDNSPWDSAEDPDRSPLRPGGPPLADSAAAALPVADWVFTDAVSTKEVR